MNVGKTSSGAWNAPAAAGSIGRPLKKAKSMTPIARKSDIWRRTTNPLPIRALRASDKPRQARRRWTIS
jgi:hypothetical protein